MRLAITSVFLTMVSSTALVAQRDIRVERIVPRKQLALVIGNAAYDRVGRLKNPVNDAEAIGRRLQDLKFEVLLVRDAGRKQMAQKVDEFVNRLGPGTVGLFYYAGHGVQLESENYLIPVDFEGETESDVRYDAFAVGKVQDRMERSGSDLNILVLDACRTNPFRFRGRAATTGWAAMSAGRGTFIAFATAPNSIANDNPDAANGLFTQYLLEALSVEGLGLDDVFNVVRARVDGASSSKQLPWTHSSVVGWYTFMPKKETWVADPFIGDWKMNAARSRFEGRRMPNSQSLRFEPEEGGLRFTEQTDAQGTVTTNVFHMRFDGKVYPALAGNGRTVSRRGIDAQTHEGTFMRAGKVESRDRWVVSPDGKTITRTIWSEDVPSIRPYKIVIVYDRQ